MNGASAALAISPIPVADPRRRRADRQARRRLRRQPRGGDLDELEMDLIVAGSDEAILMVECGANGVTEAEVLDALDIAHGEIKKLCRRDARSCARRPARRRSRSRRRRSTRACSRRSGPRTARSSTRRRRSRRSSRARTRSNAVEEEVARAVRSPPARTARSTPSGGPRSSARSRSSRRTSSASRIAVDKKRPDGRAQDEIRPIECEVDISPRVHGSALFTRGETQILSNVALGTTPHGHAGRQPRPAGDEALLAPLQLPAVLGRGGRLHARPEAPRHRPRRARRAGAACRRSRRGGLPLRDPGRSPRRSSPTAPRRWARSAPPRWRCRPRACRSPRRSPASRWA